MKKDKAYLQDMLEAIRDIQSFTKNIDEKEFLRNKEKQYAVIRGLEILGEACKNVSKELKERYHDIPWSEGEESNASVIANPPQAGEAI